MSKKLTYHTKKKEKVKATNKHRCVKGILYKRLTNHHKPLLTVLLVVAIFLLQFHSKVYYIEIKIREWESLEYDPKPMNTT